MTDAMLLQRLRKVGLETFAEYYRELSDPSVSFRQLYERLIADKGYGSDSALYKVGFGRGIISDGLGPDAVRMIASSKNDRAMVYALAQLRAMDEW